MGHGVIPCDVMYCLRQRSRDGNAALPMQELWGRKAVEWQGSWAWNACKVPTSAAPCFKYMPTSLCSARQSP